MAKKLIAKMKQYYKLPGLPQVTVDPPSSLGSSPVSRSISTGCVLVSKYGGVLPGDGASREGDGIGLCAQGRVFLSSSKRRFIELMRAPKFL